MHEPQLFFSKDCTGLFYFRFEDDDGIVHETSFDGRHGRMILALINAWKLDEGHHESFRGCRTRREYAELVPQLRGEVAALLEDTIDDYVFSIRARTREIFDCSPRASEVGFRVVETVPQRGYRAGPLLRETSVVVHGGPRSV